jgi:hypothetical protein
MLQSFDGATEIAAQGFLKLLKFMRIVICQDAAMLIDQYNGFVVYKHPIFKSNLFISFKSKLTKCLNDQRHVDPLHARLEVVAPDLVSLCSSIYSLINSFVYTV